MQENKQLIIRTNLSHELLSSISSDDNNESIKILINYLMNTFKMYDFKTKVITKIDVMDKINIINDVEYCDKVIYIKLEEDDHYKDLQVLTKEGLKIAQNNKYKTKISEDFNL